MIRRTDRTLSLQLPTLNCNLLLFIFSFAQPFEHGETSLFGVRNGERLEFVRSIEGGKDLVHRLFAGWTLRQLRRAQWPAQGEFAAAHLALAFTQLIFIKRHTSNFDSRLLIVERSLIRSVR